MSATSQLEPEAFLGKFGLTSFREGQQEVINAVLAKRDCLCIMPTGGGKSLCYQLPSVAREGVTLVVSPLIALMKDQVDALQRHGLRASFVNSSLSPAEQAERLETLASGGYDLLYVAPERFRHQRFLESLRRTTLGLLAIDEAHCISEWGHDFRPDYARLGEYRRRLGNPPTIALTATATKLVRDDVIKVLGLADPAVFITGFARPNLRFEVETPTSKGQKTQALLNFLSECEGGAGIIYAATRKRCEELVELLRERTRRRVGAYHAGLESQQRRMIQEAFMAGNIDVIVATNAFGMGIDKSDLRFVLHFNIPGSLEAYYQEAGRAGRDGLNSRCRLLYTASDRYIQEFFVENAYPSRETIKIVWEFLREQTADPIELTQEEIKDALGGNLAAGGIGACLQILDRAGAIERIAPQQNMAAVRIDHESPSLVDLLPPQAKTQRKVMRFIERLVGDLRGERVFFTLREAVSRSELDQDALVRAMRELNRYAWFSFIPPFRGKATHLVQPEREFDQLEIDFEKLDQLRDAEYKKLDLMVKYAYSRQCRQVEILEYFGDPHRQPCGTCDRCDPSGRNSIMPPPAPASGPSGEAERSKPVAAASAALEVDREKLTEVARMALSGIARTDSRFGKKLIAQMLFGSATAQIRKWRLDQLSTYGLLKHLLLKEVEQVLDSLIAAGLAQQKDIEKFRPVFALTAEGGEVMRGNAPLPVSFDLPTEILSKIGALRSGRGAKAVGAESKPSPPAAAAEPKAPASPSKAAPPGPSPTPATPRQPLPATDAPQASYYWTWHLLADGYPWAAVLSIRGISATTALVHLQQAIAQRREVRARWFLSSERLEEMSRTFNREENPSVGSLQEALGEHWLLEEIDLYVKCRALESNGQP